MPQLINTRNSSLLADNLKLAKTFMQKTKGLIGTKKLNEKEALWISPCPSVHTFFMSFSIDVIFTDKNLKVTSLFENIPPGKILWGGIRSYNVFEMKEGRIQTTQVKKGDVLYVEY